MNSYPSRDDHILITVVGQGSTIHRLSVDDFDDPHETLISREEIHMTLVASNPGEPESTPLFWALSTVSAQKLVDELTAAIIKRECL